MRISHHSEKKAAKNITAWLIAFFFKLVSTPCKAEQPLRGMELQEKEAQKG